MTTHNKKHEQYITAVNNRFRGTQTETDETIINDIENLQNWVQLEIATRIDDKNPAWKTLQEIDNILEEAYWQYFEAKQKKNKGQKAIHRRHHGGTD